MSIQSPIDNKVPDHAAWLRQTFTLNTIIQKYSPEYPDQEKDQEKQKRLVSSPPISILFFSCDMF